MIEVRARIALAASLLGWFCALSVPAAAQTAARWPQRSVKFILPFGAAAPPIGRPADVRKALRQVGQAVVIENRPGADGLLAINAFVSANDDHVLLYASSASFNAHPYMQEKLPYDLERDLAPIAQVTDTDPHR